MAQASLVLNGGVITISNGAKLLIDNPAVNGINHIAGHIVSEGENNQVIWNIGNASGTYIIPWGTITGTPFYLYVLVEPGANGINGSFEFSTYGTGANNLPFPSMVTHLNNVFTALDNSLYTVDRFWLVNAANYLTKPQVQLDFNFLSAEHAAPNTITAANLQAQRFNTNTNIWGDWGPLGISALGSVGGSSLIVSPTDFFTAWTLVDNTQPLPIELLTYTGKCEEDKINITWSTASETNNALFNIYKSTDNRDFEWVHSTPGAINSTQKIDYLYSDLDIIPGQHYAYQLEQVDINGTTKTFNAIEVKACKSKEFSSAAYYANGNIIIHNTGSNDNNLRVFISNKLGQIIRSENWNTSLNGSQLKLTSVLSSGIYFVNIFNEEVNETHKILVY